MESTEFLNVLTLVYEDNDLDEIIGNTNPKTYKRQIVIPYANIFFVQEGIDKHQTEIYLSDGELIIALEKIAVIEEKWHLWYNKYYSLHFYTKAN
jgi:hypothetical protein